MEITSMTKPQNKPDQVGIRNLKEIDYQSDWQERWTEGRTGWDQGAPHQFLPDLLHYCIQHKLLKIGDTILEPGCGRAHGGAYLASQGFDVTSFDITEEAITQAKSLYGHLSNLQLQVQDALVINPYWKHKFNGIFDRAMLCALASPLRSFYLDFCYQALKTGGVFTSILFTEVDLAPTDGPPFAVGREEIEFLIKDRFAVFHEEALLPVASGKIKSESMLILIKKDHQPC
jgi:SAM-dependent methyltransferase